MSIVNESGTNAKSVIKTKRIKPGTNNIPPHSQVQDQLSWNGGACARKVSEAGWSFFWGASGTAGLLGDVATAVFVGKNSSVTIFNSTGTTKYIAFGAIGMAAPTGATNGLPILAGERIVLSSGSNTYVRSSAAGVYAFLPETHEIVEG